MLKDVFKILIPYESLSPSRKIYRWIWIEQTATIIPLGRNIFDLCLTKSAFHQSPRPKVELAIYTIQSYI